MHKTLTQWSKTQPAGTVDRWALDQSLLVLAMEDLEEIRALLDTVAEYLERRADADMDQYGYVPNAEMRLLVEVREANDGRAY